MSNITSAKITQILTDTHRDEAIIRVEFLGEKPNGDKIKIQKDFQVGKPEEVNQAVMQEKVRTERERIDALIAEAEVLEQSIGQELL